MTLAQIAEVLNGALVGDPALDVEALGAPDATAAGRLVCAFDSASLTSAEINGAAAVVVAEGTATELPHVSVPNPRHALLTLLKAFEPPLPPSRGVHPTAVVDPTAEIGWDVEIGPLCVIEAGVEIGARSRLGPHCVIGAGARLGEDCRLAARVTVGERCQLGARVRLESGVVLGAPGFGYRYVDGAQRAVPQLGIVVLEDDVDLGANTCVDRATIGETRLGAGTKLDNLVQIAHNVHVGRHCVMAAQVGIAGSTTLGHGIVLAGQVGVGDHCTIGDGAMVGPQAGVMSSVPAGGRYFGCPASPEPLAFRMVAATRRLPAALKALRLIKSKLGIEADHEG